MQPTSHCFNEPKTIEDTYNYFCENNIYGNDVIDASYAMMLHPDGYVFIIIHKIETKFYDPDRNNDPIPEYHRKLEGTYSILNDDDLELKLEIRLTKEKE